MTENIKLYTALLAAQAAIKALAKDSENKYSDYKYTAAENIIEEARRVGIDAGLVFRQTGPIEIGEGPEPVILLTHTITHAESGERICESTKWIMVPKKGTPPDKALASALTSALGYWLRDTLLIPRGTEHQMDKRNDADYTPPVALNIMPDQVILLKDLIKETSTDIRKFNSAYGITALENLPLLRFAHAHESLRRKLENIEKFKESKKALQPLTTDGEPK